MTGRELLCKAIRNETTPRPAWVPFVGVHGAALAGVTAREYLQSAEAVVAGLEAAAERYRPDGLPVMFDLQLEAEALGCTLKWSDETPPSVISHPLESGVALPDLPVFDPSMGRFPVALDALRTLKERIGGEVALYGLICGPFTLALHLMGNEIFLQMFDHPDYVKAVVGFCAAVGRKVAQAYLEQGADVIGVVDPMTSQISPDNFETFVADPANEIFSSIRRGGGLSSLFVCGDATRNLEAMARTQCDNISIDENIPLQKLRDVTRAEGRSFGGNLKLTSVLLLGDEDDARLDAIRCIDVGGSCGFVLAPGCDLPFATPPRNLEAVAEMVHDAYRREVAKRTIVVRTAESAAELPPINYDDEPHVTIDIVTLDSASCAPCQYMVDAVHRAARHLAEPLRIREHRIATREGIAMMHRLGVRNIPTICIDGEVAFASIIPDLHTLTDRIEASIAARGKAEG